MSYDEEKFIPPKQLMQEWRKNDLLVTFEYLSKNVTNNVNLNLSITSILFKKNKERPTKYL